MKSKSIKKLYTLHSWVGIITGILLFVIAFTGAVSVFGRPELKIWANPEIRSEIKLDLPRIERLVEQYADEVPETYKEEVIVFLPGARSFKNLTVLFEAHSGIEEEQQTQAAQETAPQHQGPVGVLYQFHPTTLELVSKKEGPLQALFADRESDMADFLVTFHADLHLGRPIGLLLTGILGLTLMLSIVTGVVIHRKILAQLFTFRPGKSFSLLLNDGHKAIGIWGILFHSTIGFTGAILGLAFVVLVPAAAYVSFEGDQDALVETFTAIPDPVIQNIEAPTQLTEIISRANNLHDEVEVNAVTIKGYGDTSAMAYVSILGGENMAAETAVFNGATAEYIERYGNLARIEGFSGRILDLIFPLHFGNFGGIFVKFIWAILGLGTALLPLTGMMLWLERGVNAANPKYSMKTYNRFNRLIIGGCGGIVLACLVMFPAQLILGSVIGVQNVGGVLGWIFFPVWLLSIVWAFLVKNELSVAKIMVYVSAALLISIMPLNGLLTGSHLFNVMHTNHYVTLGVDLTTFLMGLGILVYFRRAKLKSSKGTNTNLLSQPVATDKGI